MARVMVLPHLNYPMNGKFVVGTGTATDHIDEGGFENTYSLSDTGGTQKQKMSIAEMPSHNRTLNVKQQANPGSYYNELQTGSAGGGTWNLTTNNTGSNNSHENRPPFITLNYIIRII